AFNREFHIAFGSAQIKIFTNMVPYLLLTLFPCFSIRLRDAIKDKIILSILIFH
ncbi:hypothetical protein M9458_013629, partial [Cirrhinus mrigala]